MASEQQEIPQPSQVYNNYMKELRQWRHDCDMYKWMWSQHWMMHSAAMHQAFVNTLPNINNGAPSPSEVSRPTFNPPQANGRAPSSNQQHYVYRIPSIGRRVMAEMVDFAILFTVKMLIIALLVTMFDISYGNITLQMLFLDDADIDDFNNAQQQDDLETMLYLALVYRIMACLYEWLFIWYRGATPGKLLFDLKVITCHVSHGRNENVTVIPATAVSSPSAWTRALVKNLSIAFMIPSFITAFFYLHRRTSYDVLSRCIVVRTTPVRQH